MGKNHRDVSAHFGETNQVPSHTQEPKDPSRRSFLGKVSGVAAGSHRQLDHAETFTRRKGFDGGWVHGGLRFRPSCQGMQQL
jgi:hypothetical protein